MTFAHPQLFWLLVLPAALLLATLRRARTAAVSAHPKIPRVLLHSSPSSNPRATAHRTARPVALALALSAIILALARPQGATLPGLAHSNAREVLVAVDVSRSMLADDLKPDRLSRARLLIRALLDELKGERLGLLPFAGTAFLQSPLSSDYEIFRTFLDELGPDMIPAGGSNFSALLKIAADAFSTGDADRYLIILSDGEAQEDNWRAPAEALAKRGVRILSLGFGTLDGAMVPDGKGGLVKDQRGAVVLTRLDATTLRELARATGGEYRDATTFVDLPALLRATVAQGRAGAFEETDATRRVELFPWFLAPALLLLAYALWREFPTVPTPRKTQLLAAARTALWLLVLHPAFVIDHSSFAAEASPAAPAPDPLVSLVGQLATAPTLAPADLARLAELTASTGETARAAKKNLPEGALRDALTAIDSGNITAPSAADWPALRKRIETLLAPPPQPPKKDESKDDQKSDQSKTDKSDSSENQSSPSDSKKPDDPSGSPSESQSPSSEDETPKPSSGDDKSNNSSPDAKDPSSPSAPSTEKPLSDLASDPKQPPEKGTDSTQSSPPPPDASTQQQAGGVAAEGTTDPSASDPANANSALLVPRQKLDNVRASDSPARLYQLLNDSESPPGSATRAAGRKQDW